jgi:hypothetical protein
MTDKKHVWRVGDLCRRTHDDHAGVVYRVIDVEERDDGTAKAMWIKPVLWLLAHPQHKTHETTPSNVELLTLVSLGLERNKLDNLLLSEARKHNELPPIPPATPAEQTPTLGFEELQS